MLKGRFAYLFDIHVNVKMNMKTEHLLTFSIALKAIKETSVHYMPQP